MSFIKGFIDGLKGKDGNISPAVLAVIAAVLLGLKAVMLLLSR